ncbi:MAG: chromosome segregation protein SMC [Paludibacterium sp.]|uniref:chromosome segregation protein SMC n=1 Tax=Paludibacterium sp. TaxID=1917523 RepID=UPI0025ED3406|nr:chromosome segregation protein SMC [Paludibacterium sp.]MBV8048089.1 chromosome segregation protein SMC [Paludibacterium sp.]MBV8645995.1 chromosome segregation protein SMC [Paludibacterium sp.]
MRLTHIKLSGFKSFVDPTTIPVPGQLVAVIGPNGCGKSNVIDAVRWVLGESSAKQLRGESMQDVIFNGSTTRKPVSRASVELVFDNADGQLTGPWGQYAEVAIKRVLTRQGESTYLINNQVVRRRDITDLFLGTGVGARGYAVIEQGMISRIIEARPEELRVYLEEAAGVSRYKERRRETENRLGDTRDNLSRVDDLRQELARQVDRLAEQAAVAAQYHDLRAALTHKQNLLALARREEAARNEADARAELARLESEEARLGQALSALEAEIETVRDGHFDAGDRVQAAQQRVSETNAQLARLEEQQRHRQETRARLERDLAQARNDRAMLADEQSGIADERGEWQQQCEVLRLQMEEAMLRVEEDGVQLPDAEAAYADSEARQQQLTEDYAEQVRRRDLAGQRLTHLREARRQAAERLEALRREQTALNLPSAEALDDAARAVENAKHALDAVQQRVVADEAKLADLTREREKLDETLTRLRGETARAEAEASALSALLSREQDSGALSDWLAAHGLQDAPVLWQSLTVEPAWHDALEAVLAERLTARAGSVPTQAPPGPLTVIDASSPAAPVRPHAGWQTLRDQVRAPAPFDTALDDWLVGVYLAESLEAALTERPRLAAGEWLVTPQGHRVGRHGVQFHGEAGGDGLMAQKARLEDAVARAAALAPQLAAAQGQRERVAGQMSMLAEAVRAQKGATTRLDGELNAATVAHVRLDQAARQGSARRDAILGEEAVLADLLATSDAQMQEAGEEAETVTLALETLDEALADARAARGRAQDTLAQARERRQQTERQTHDIRLRLQAAEQKVAELSRRDAERDERDALLAERLATLAEESAMLEEDDVQEALQTLLLARESGEGALAAARDALNGLAERMRGLTLQQHEISQALPDLRAARQTALLAHQEARLGMERFAEELREAEVDEAALLADLSAGVKPATLMNEIARLARAVDGLGAVNLAALEELEQARVRGEYLGAQADDLQQAIETLEAAIRKIDGESRAILQSTFDAVNAQMSEFFPTLFGGGRAELMLTGEDLLDAGVQIIAQPPGKKNSTIHLLSGGEKALTAMSLVFSLFSLNPAPFCLLDEVDAPLDDANTSRFCDLVKQMSARTQFLYISHNRLTMEMAEQLVGVTMQEKGVSRVVAVDIVEALQMRETA